MAELDVWMATLNRDDVQTLPHDTRMALYSIAATVADNQPEVDGFLPRAGLRHVPWGIGSRADLQVHIDQLVVAGFLQKADDPEGYLLVGWLLRPTRYKAGNAESAEMAWGQQSSAHWTSVREQRAARSRKSRAKRKAADAVEE
jgi:hypothetical protein